jgi:hypothetical protein
LLNGRDAVDDAGATPGGRRLRYGLRAEVLAAGSDE